MYDLNMYIWQETGKRKNVILMLTLILSFFFFFNLIAENQYIIFQISFKKLLF